MIHLIPINRKLKVIYHFDNHPSRLVTIFCSTAASKGKGIAVAAAETTADAGRCPVAQCRVLATVTVKHYVWSIQATNNNQAGVQLWT